MVQSIVFDLIANAVKAYNQKQITGDEYDSIIEECNDLLFQHEIK